MTIEEAKRGSPESQTVLDHLSALTGPDESLYEHHIQKLALLLQERQAKHIGRHDPEAQVWGQGLHMISSPMEGGNGSASMSLHQSFPFDVLFDTELAYVLKRLIRGLASASARLGYTCLLTRLLTTFPEIRPRSLCLMMDTYLGFSSGSSKVEQGDILLGRLCILMAIHQAYQAQQTSLLSDPNLTYLVRDLLTRLHMKSYATYPIALVLRNLFSSMPSSMGSALSAFTTGMGSLDPLSCPEALGLYLTLHRCHLEPPSLPSAHPLQVLLSHSLPDHSLSQEDSGLVTCFQTLASVLKDTPVRVHPQVHFLWQELLELPLVIAHFGLFWKICVDEALFHSNSHEKKYLGLELFDRQLSAQSHLISTLFSPHLVRVLGHALSSPKNLLYQRAFGTIQSLTRLAKEVSIAAPLLLILQNIKHLLPGSMATNLSEACIAALTPAELDAYFLLMTSTLCDQSASPTHADANRLWPLEQLCLMVKHAPE